MAPFSEIIDLAAARHGGEVALLSRLEIPASATQIRAIADSRWLSEATKCVFQAGFNWRTIEHKWPSFEAAFAGFELHRCATMNDADLDRLLARDDIVRNAAKIASVGRNARFFLDLADAYGSVGAWFAGWQADAYCTNLTALQNGGARLGGRTGQTFLRRMGVDSIVFTPNVLAALRREGVVAKMPGSKRDFEALQRALAQWGEESGLSLTQISQILALSIG